MLKRRVAVVAIIFFFVLQPMIAGQEEGQKKHLLTDIALVAGANAVYAMTIPAVRHGIFNHWSLDRVGDNFADPWRRAVEGGREDDNSFWMNYVGHPLSFALLGLFLSERGYSRPGALLFTQVENVLWEYVIEGGIWKPSGKDLISDLAGSLAAIFILDPLSDRGERLLLDGDRRWGNHLLYWLNPFKRISRLLFGRGRDKAALALLPARGGFSLSFYWQPSR